MDLGSPDDRGFEVIVLLELAEELAHGRHLLFLGSLVARQETLLKTVTQVKDGLLALIETLSLGELLLLLCGLLVDLGCSDLLLGLGGRCFLRGGRVSSVGRLGCVQLRDFGRLLRLLRVSQRCCIQ